MTNVTSHPHSSLGEGEPNVGPHAEHETQRRECRESATSCSECGSAKYIVELSRAPYGVRCRVTGSIRSVWRNSRLRNARRRRRRRCVDRFSGILVRRDQAGRCLDTSVVFFAPECTGWIPMRVLICLMIFTACWTSYMCRLQMPILAVPMIREQPINHTTGVCMFDEQAASSRLRRSIILSALDPASYLESYVLDDIELKRTQSQWRHSLHRREADGKRAPRSPDVVTRPTNARIQLFSGLPFDWTPEVRGQLIAAYSYGNVPGNLIGGYLALRYGPRQAVLWTSLLAAVISLVSPILAQIHWGALFVSRIIVGVTGGVVFPAGHTIVAKWAPPNEKSRFVWSLLGGTFGTIFTYPMVAAIAETIDWESAWYIPSILMLVWIIVWALIAYDSPTEHPGITPEERDYILSSQVGTVSREKPTWKQVPVKKILTSIPFLSLTVLHFGNLFLLFFYQNSLMLYLTKALGFQLTKGGVAAGAPWGGRMLFGFFFSWIGDTIKKRNLMSITSLRKVATLFSHLLPGIFLVLVGYVGCDIVLANVCLAFALAFNGAAIISNLSNNQDLAPNFAGFLYGIINTIGSISGIIIPPMVEEIAGKYGNPIDRWQTVFWIGAAVCIASMVTFLFGGSGQIQSWNEIQSERSNDQELEEPQKN